MYSFIKQCTFTFLVAFLALPVSATTHHFAVRDSQSGAVVDAKVTVQKFNEQHLSPAKWKDIKLGNPIADQIPTAVLQLNHSQNRYALTTDPDTKNDLLVLTISAKGYRTLRTYLEGGAPTQLTQIMLDSEQSSAPCSPDSICGFIYNKANLKPLKDTVVTLLDGSHTTTGETDSSGYFSLDNTENKNGVLTIQHPGFQKRVFNHLPQNSSFHLIIDVEHGHGTQEQSKRHPLQTVQGQPLDPEWLAGKLAQLPTSDPVHLRERPTGAVYLQPPGSIRVGFNGSGGSCCGSGCATSQVYSLETYVQRGLDDEWIASWQADSLKAGSIPFRSYGAWHVLNSVYTGYDICAGPCCQAFEYDGYTASMNAAAATNGIMLDRNGEVARSEYSAQNNSWDDPNDGLNCSNVDLSCGDGYVGSPSTDWGCLSDLVSLGRGCFGHGRGMSQWGTQYHAQNGETFADIVDHYYNDSNNPAGQRSQYASTPIRLDGVNSSTDSVSANEVFSIEFDLFNSADTSQPFGPILLGASLVSNAGSHSDPGNDLSMDVTHSGSGLVQRIFIVPIGTSPGLYDLVTAIYLDVDGDGDISATDWKLVTATQDNPITVLAANDLIFKDGFNPISMNP